MAGSSNVPKFHFGVNKITLDVFKSQMDVDDEGECKIFKFGINEQTVVSTATPAQPRFLSQSTSVISGQQMAASVPLQTHSSLQPMPDLSQCILIPDKNGIHQAHPVMPGGIQVVKMMVGPPIVIPGSVATLTPMTIHHSTLYHGQLASGTSAAFGSTGSSIFSGSNTSLASQQSAVSQSSASGIATAGGVYDLRRRYELMARSGNMCELNKLKDEIDMSIHYMQQHNVKFGQEEVSPGDSSIENGIEQFADKSSGRPVAIVHDDVVRSPCNVDNDDGMNSETSSANSQTNDLLRKPKKGFLSRLNSALHKVIWIRN